MTFAHAIHLADIDRVQVTTGLTAGGEIHVRTSTGTTDIARLTPDMADLLAGALTEVAARARRTTARTPAGHDPADAHGPYQTRGEANQSPAVQAVWKAYSAAPGTGRMAAHCLAILTDACTTAGILTGAYDLTVMAWLSGWEPETCQVIAGLITRAAARTGWDLPPAVMPIPAQLAGVVPTTAFSPPERAAWTVAIARALPVTAADVRAMVQAALPDGQAELDARLDCVACWHLWTLHSDDGCTAKVFPAGSIDGVRCPCEHAGTEAGQ
jgi:hypothetical protein